MKKSDFEGIVQGLSEATAFARGDDVPGLRVHIPPEIDVRALRERLNLTQADFASRYGFSVARVRDWEQGRRMPNSGVRAFLKVIDAEPEMVTKVLESA